MNYVPKILFPYRFFGTVSDAIVSFKKAAEKTWEQFVRLLGNSLQK